ncbi:DNA integrity scanning protein DisA [archaeon]|nr:DNA integrity scanning protein DisA [archaeon]NCP79123.1 DNA integrity scanning protein DisA [archaeon]NCP97931.1 DNA integrity scanning protein DisA [archaeon]NCQ06890.1 DNA integrity scanning protein DisA [archaeon]NCQ50686.1 DNA integrity scanning protein DisA [archaeon]
MPTRPKKKVFIQEEDFQSKLISQIHENDVIDITKILPLVTPGTELRSGLDEILHGNLGALIVLGDSDKLKPILKGGIDLDIPFSSQKLFELSKMDGAIVLSNDLTKIVGANKHLMPDRDISSKETGMRHRSAEQTAMQSDLPVIAISHRRNVISLYYKDQKYVLQDFNILMVKASYAINNLKDFRSKIDKKIKNLYDLEIILSNNLKTEVLDLIQNILYFFKNETQVDDLIVELGSQGQDISNSFYEITYGLEEELYLILKDYSNNIYLKEECLEKINFLKQLGIRKIADTEKLIDILELSNFTSQKEFDFPRGYRFFSKITEIDEKTINSLINSQNSLKTIKSLNLSDISKIQGIDSSKSKIIYNYINKVYTHKI